MKISRTAALWAALVVVPTGVAACTSGDASDPDSTDRTVQPEADGYEATIRRTTDGVPHVVADDLASLSFGNGYASAQDRLCDLIDQVVKIRGERSRWFGAGDGDVNLHSDLAWRSLGIHERAKTELPSKSDDIRAVFDGFAAGWNAYLADTGVENLPFWCADEEWVQPLSGLDVYAYARSVTLGASGARLVDYIATARPPAEPSRAGTERATLDARSPSEYVGASNGWAIGHERSTDGGGLLLANPHFPWEGELRFWEVHLTVPGLLDVYGAQLSGLPGVGIGFTEDFAWTHTVSAGNRFTVYTLDLVPGDPTSYLYDGEPRPMSSKEVDIDVRQPDGTASTERHTLWFSHYGPILDFPGAGWTDARAITFRDANLDNDESVDQYLAMNRASTFDDFVSAHEEHQGIPLFNTIAVSNDGRAWYADTSATPNLSREAIEAYAVSVSTDPIAGIASQAGAVLLDGSTSLNEWLDEPGARDPGLVPYGKMPQIERADYVFNANDSFWLPNADHVLEGDYSLLHGRQATARSPRTRENAVVLRDTSSSGASGVDGRFDLDELAAAALQNRGYTSRILKDEVVRRCTATAEVQVPPFVTSTGDELLPAATVDVREACRILGEWDGVYDLDRVGPLVWREFMSRWEAPQLREAGVGTLWSTGFRADEPVETPAGLWDGDATDPLWAQNLARAVQIVAAAGLPLDARLGDIQYADRNGTRVPLHGGTNFDGTTNIVDYGRGSTTREPSVTRGSTVVPRSGLTSSGYLVNNGSSFVMTVHFGPTGPEAMILLAYGETANRDDPLFVEATRRFSSKDWRTVAFKNGAIASDRNLEETTVSG